MSLSISPLSLSFVNFVWGFTPREGSTSGTLSVTTSGTWSITASPWVLCSPLSGTGNATVSVTVFNESSLPHGSAVNRVDLGNYFGTIVVTPGSGSPVTVPVLYSVGYGDLLGVDAPNQPSAPTFSPDGGVYSGSVTIAATSSPDAIYYSLSGGTGWTLYSHPVTVTAPVTLTAFATKNGVASPISITSFQVPVPTFLTRISAGAVGSQTVTIDSTGATLVVAAVLSGEFTLAGPYAAPCTLTDTLGNTWIPLSFNPFVLQTLQLFYTLAPVTSTNHIITATSPTPRIGGGPVTIDVLAFSNVSSFATGTDLFNSTPLPASTLAVGSVSANSYDLVVTVVSGSGAQGGGTAPSGFTLVNGCVPFIAYYIMPSSGSINPTWTGISYVGGGSIIGAEAVFHHA